PVYSTITVVCTLLLYLSYVLPTALGLCAYGRGWTRMGPWQLGRWYRPLAVVAVLGCVGLLVLGIQPPTEKAVAVVGGMVLALLIGWFAAARYGFPGPPLGVADLKRQAEIRAAEKAVHQETVD